MFKSKNIYYLPIVAWLEGSTYPYVVVRVVQGRRAGGVLRLARSQLTESSLVARFAV